jgi:hypothetical protein
MGNRQVRARLLMCSCVYTRMILIATFRALTIANLQDREQRPYDDRHRRYFLGCSVRLRADVVRIGSDRSRARIQGEPFDC